MDKYSLWRKNWPRGLPTQSTFPYGKMPIADCLRKHAEATPDKGAIQFYGREVTFKEWDEAANRLANSLIDMGYKKGDKVLLYMHNCPQFCIAYIAAARIGMIIFTADPGFKEFELEYEINDSGASLVFAFDNNYQDLLPLRKRIDIKDVIITSFHDFLAETPTLPLHPIMTSPKQSFADVLEFCDLLENYPANPPKVDIGMDELEVVLYTGGTTGLPKGTAHSHENTLRGGAFCYQLMVVGKDLSPCDSILVFGPLSHVAALSFGLFPSCVHGRTMVVLSRYDSDTTLQAIDKYKIELIQGTVMVYNELMNHPDLEKYDLSSIKIFTPGEWMIWLTPEFAKKVENVMGAPAVKMGYSMSEVVLVGVCGSRVGYEIPFKDEFLMGTVPPDEGIDIRIVDFRTRQDVPLGEKGEIVIKSPACCRYYWNKPKETEESFTSDGWFYTGDIGMLDEEGYLYWYGRQKYLIRVSGFNVSGGEIEMIGRNCPEITNIAVAGIPHPKKGQIPKAFVQLVPGSNATAEDIQGWFKDHIAAYKVPLVEVRSQLPLTLKGAVDMKNLLSKG